MANVMTDGSDAVLACIVCSKALEGVFTGDFNHANDACEFRTPGQYGSTVFDEMDGSRLIVNICDGCLREAAKRKQVMVLEGPPRAVPKFWDGK